jgi:hypothetical protein
MDTVLVREKMENVKISSQAGIPSPLAISSLRGRLVEKGLVFERVTAPTLSFRHSFVGSLLSPSLVLSMYKYTRWVPLH